MSNSEFNFMLLGVYGAILFGALIVSLIIFVYKGILFYRLCQENGIKHKWLSWIPVGSDYIMLKLGDMSPIYIWLFVVGYLCNGVSNWLNEEHFMMYYPIYFVIAIVQSVVVICSLRKIIRKYQRGLGLLVIEILYFVLLLLSICSIG